MKSLKVYIFNVFLFSMQANVNLWIPTTWQLQEYMKIYLFLEIFFYPLQKCFPSLSTNNFLKIKLPPPFHILLVNMIGIRKFNV